MLLQIQGCHRSCMPGGWIPVQARLLLPTCAQLSPEYPGWQVAQVHRLVLKVTQLVMDGHCWQAPLTSCQPFLQVWHWQLPALT